jgi:superfamily II DNA/RNA helicase
VNRENRAGSFRPAEDIVLERLQAKQILAEDAAGKTFGDLGLGDNIVRVLAGLGAEAPFPIQAATIPDVLAGRDVLGRGRTGSGKTIAFGAPLVERLLKMKAEGAFDNDPPRERPERPQRGERPTNRRRTPGRKPKAIILAPTRELALQIDRTVQPIARSVGLFTTQVYGGVPQARQVGALERGVDIIIGTPGRIEDLIRQGHLDLREVVISVLDEADHMCDLGFLEPVQRILRSTARGAQKMLFSATLDQGVAKLVKEFLENPAVHEVAGEDQASGTIDHQVIIVNREDKLEVLRQLGDRDDKTVIFTRTRAYAEQLTEMFEDAGIAAVALHGDLNQARRTRNLERLTSGRARVLVATDVAARGIHVDDVSLIIQADAPDDYKTYMHRAGRTGRAGKSGSVLTVIPRNRQSRTSELLERAEITPTFFSEFYPGDALPQPSFRDAPVAKATSSIAETVEEVFAPEVKAKTRKKAVVKTSVVTKPIEAEAEIVSATFIAEVDAAVDGDEDTVV